MTNCQPSSPVGFTEGLTGLCEKNEYVLEYRNDSQVTVNLLKHSPKTRILIMRMHSGVFEEKVWIFAGEEYSESKHVLDQVRGSIHIARCSSTSEIVFAVGEVFIDENWSELNGALIVLMGCSSLADTGLAEVMGDKGAIGVVGWSDDVSIEFSDETVLELMASLWKGKKLGDIVDEVNKRHEGLRMRYYPDSLGPFRLFEP